MKAILKSCARVTIPSLLFLCSCATMHPPLPADVPMNKEAGHGGWLIAMVRVDDSEPLPFIIDTGSPISCLDKSLEQKLGRRLADANFLNYGVTRPGGAYLPPRFHLGNTPLRNSGAFVVTFDFKPVSKDAHLQAMGALGMDVLKHYCVQLDFQSGQMRFLDEEHADRNAWGKPFHLSDVGDGCVAIAENLTGAKDPPSMIDTGSDWDGFLVPKLFRQWTNRAVAPAPGQRRSPDGILGGEDYHELDLRISSAADHDSHAGFNVIGLHVLSENLVTFDFPKRTMYLKRTSKRPL